MANGCKDVLFARGAGQSDDSDIWDDTALIKAYDKAVASFKTALKGEEEPQSAKKSDPGKKRKNNKKSDSRKRANAPANKEWEVGDSCSAYWSQDGQLYTAIISSIDEKRRTCVVLYRDYGNEEEHKLEDLLSDVSEAEDDSKTKVNEVESSTEESDRSTTPKQNKQPHSKSQKHKPQRAPPTMWPPAFPGFPAGPPPMPTFKKDGRKQPGGHGPLPPPWHPGMLPFGPPMIPPPPPMSPDTVDDEALGSMLISWYMSGYHTGYYLGLKQGRKEASKLSKHHHK